MIYILAQRGVLIRFADDIDDRNKIQNNLLIGWKIDSNQEDEL